MTGTPSPRHSRYRESLGDRHPVLMVFPMLASAAIPGVALYFITGGAMWAAVLSGVLALPFGVIGYAVVEVVVERG